MKRLLAVVVLCCIAGSLYAAQALRQGPTTIDVPNTADVDGLTIDQNDLGQAALTISSGTIVLWSRTAAQLGSLTPPATGALLYCSDCTKSGVCVSSGTGVAAWVIPVSTGAQTFSSVRCQ
jgi:hypothetical protein